MKVTSSVFVRAKEPAGLSTFSDTYVDNVERPASLKNKNLPQAKDKALFAILDYLLEIFLHPTAVALQ